MVRKMFVCGLVFLSVFLLSACGVFRDSVDIVSVEVDTSNIQGDIYLDTFELSDVSLIITRSDEEVASIPLEASMLSDADLEKLQTPGAHSISVSYLGFNLSFEITLVERVDELTEQLMSIFTTGSNEGHISGTYEAWLESIQGEDGTSIVEVVINEGGHLIITLCSDEVIDAGLVTGREVEFNVSESHIQWRYKDDTTWENLVALETLKGAKGDTGSAGREVEFNISETYIQWRYDQETAWHDLLPLSLLMGTPGEDGKGIETMTINTQGELLVEYSDGALENLGVIAKYYTVEFKDFNEQLLSVQLVYEGQDANAPVVFDHEGRIFSGWNRDYTNIMSDMVIYAEYDFLTFTVSFESNDGSMVDAIEDIFHGETIELPVPFKEGFRFIGWYKSNSLNATPFYEDSLVTSDVTLYAQWRLRGSGQHGLAYVLIRAILGPDESVESISFNGSHSALLTSESRLYTWGNNNGGRLGDGTTLQRKHPNEITSQFNLNADETLIQVSLGFYHSGALTSEGRVFMWGLNHRGQLGNGTSHWDANPDPLDITGYFDLDVDEIIIRIELGHTHSAALSSKGRVFTWGVNGFGQLGDDTTLNKDIPTDITDKFGLETDEWIAQISMGSNHSSALSNTGRVFVWGNNEVGRLGDGSTSHKLVPTEITHQFALDGEDAIASIVMSHTHSAALSSEGRLFTWGSNFDGEIGDGGISARYSPVEITHQIALEPEDSIIQVSLGNSVSSALSATGRVFSWGRSDSGQLGNDSPWGDFNNNPIEITAYFMLDEEEQITHLSFGYHHNSAISSHNRLFTWGSNWDGELGNGTTTLKLVPTPIDYTLDLIHYEILDYGRTIVEYTPSSVEGYIFSGWHSDIELTELYEFSTMPSQNIMLYGKWLETE